MQTIDWLIYVGAVVFCLSIACTLFITAYAFMNEIPARKFAMWIVFMSWNTLLSGRVFGWW